MAKIWSTISAGSPGKTSFVINLGIVYARRHPQEKVLVVDFNFLKPDIAIMLDLVDFSKNEYPKSLNDLYPLIVGYQTILLNQYITKPFKDLPNYYVLPGFLLRANFEDQLERKQWAYLFENLTAFADFLLFDTDQNFRHSGFQYLFGATQTFLLALDQDKLATVHARYLMEYIKGRGRQEDLKLLLLRVELNNSFNAFEVSKIVNHNVDFEIPNINRAKYEEQFYQAKPIAFNLEDHYTQALESLLDSLEGTQTINANERKNNLWKKIFPWLTMNTSLTKQKGTLTVMSSQPSIKMP